MAKTNIKIALDEWKIVELKRIAKAQGTSVSAMMQARVVEDIQKWEDEFGPLAIDGASAK